MKYPVKSRRGVYYDLSKSPYEFVSSYGEIYKFSSRKKLEMYTREYDVRMAKIYKHIACIGVLTNINVDINPNSIFSLEQKLYLDIEW